MKTTFDISKEQLEYVVGTTLIHESTRRLYSNT